MAIISTEPKKRGRKKGSENEVKENIIFIEKDIINESEIQEVDCNEEEDEQQEVKEGVKTHKKRGRKPKGGKIIQQPVTDLNNEVEAQNIILHLKCSTSDLKNNTSKLISNIDYIPESEDIQSYSLLETKGADLKDSYKSSYKEVIDNIKITANHEVYSEDDEENKESESLKEIWKKINQLKLSYHKSDICQNLGTRRSACFWDTCEFDNPTIYIPKYVINDVYHVYGCFCSAECALAYLMKENIDTSTKFERSQLLNSLYGKIFNYDKSIKPAPNPYYLLNKFYGNLSINEYRKLFKSEQMIYVVNKPLTHILPELYEDNNDFLLNNKIIPNNNLKLKKKGKNSKTDIVNETFGVLVK